MPAALEEPLLLLGDAVEAAIVVDHDDDGAVLLERCLDAEAARKEGAVAADEHDIALGMRVLRRECERDADAEQGIGPRMQDAGELLSFPPCDIHRDLRPEVGVAAVEDQPVLLRHGAVDVDGELERVHLFAPGRSRLVVGIEFGQRLLHPLAALDPVDPEPGVVEWGQGRQAVEKGARIAEQHPVGRPVQLPLFMAAVHTDQFAAFGEHRRVAEIHLVVQASADHDRHIAVFRGEPVGRILVPVRKAHIGFALLAQQFLVIGHIEDRDVEGSPGFFQLPLVAGPPHAMPADEDRPACPGKPLH